MDHISQTDYVTQFQSIYLPDYAKLICQKKKETDEKQLQTMALSSRSRSSGSQATAKSVTIQKFLLQVIFISFSAMFGWLIETFPLYVI